MNDVEAPNETCDICRFDASAYPHQDVMGTLRSLSPWWDLLTAGVPAQLLAARPAPGVWSAVEYAEHSRDVTQILTFGLELVLAEPGLLLPPAPNVPPVAATPSSATIASVLSGFDEAVARLRGIASAMRAEQARRFGLLPDGTQLSAGWIVRHAIHDALHHIGDVGRGLQQLGAGATTHRGTVHQINASGGGLPKPAITRAEIGYRGVGGDRQQSRRHHGRVWQALCLASLEAIDRLRADGHSIYPGAAGENFTLSGVDWLALRPGTRLRIGTALAELTLPALPCSNNAQWFSDGDFLRLHHGAHPGETRWYARVVEDGTVHTGDEVVVEP